MTPDCPECGVLLDGPEPHADGCTWTLENVGTDGAETREAWAARARGELHDQVHHAHAYHQPPTPDVMAAHEAVRAATGDCAHRLIEVAGPSAELTVALDKLREAMYWANAAIACHPENVRGTTH